MITFLLLNIKIFQCIFSMDCSAKKYIFWGQGMKIFTIKLLITNPRMFVRRKLISCSLNMSILLQLNEVPVNGLNTQLYTTQLNEVRCQDWKQQMTSLCTRPVYQLFSILPIASLPKCCWSQEFYFSKVDKVINFSFQRTPTSFPP